MDNDGRHHSKISNLPAIPRLFQDPRLMRKIKTTMLEIKRAAAPKPRSEIR